MAQQLKNTLPFDLAPGASVVLPHGLQLISGTPLAPDIIFIPSADLAVTSDTVAVTLTNNGGDTIVGALLVEAWHTIERAFGDDANVDLPVKPYVVVSDSSESQPLCTFVYRPGATGADAPGGNVYTDWAALMLAIDATSKLGLREIEFDSRFAGAPSPGVAIIPPGTYNMTNTVWVSTGLTSTFVGLADGVLFTVDPQSPGGDFNAMRFDGPFMQIIGNRVAGPAPFTNIDIRVSGTVVRFVQNPDLGPAALPMFAVTPAGGEITLVFDTPRGGLGDFPASLFVPPGPPLIDSGTDIVTIRSAAGLFANDIVTGSGFLSIATLAADAWGDIFNEFAQPNFTGVVEGFNVGIQFVRNNVFTPPGTDFGPVTADFGPYDASYNEMVIVDLSAGDVTINLPNANTQGVQAGERVTIKVINVPGEGEQVIVASNFGNTIEQPQITNGMGCKTWVMDGVGNWHLTAVV